MTPRAVVLVGLNCAGKTSYALTEQFADFEYINVDAEGLTPDELRDCVHSLVYHEKSFIVDSCNATRADRKVVLDIIKSYPQSQNKPRYSIECHFLRVSMGQARKNGQQRQTVGGSRLNLINLIQVNRSLEEPLSSEGFTTIIDVPFVENYENKFSNRAIFFSLDKTIRYSMGSHTFPLSPDEIRIMPDVNSIFKCYAEREYKFFGVMNAPYIAFGEVSEVTVQDCIIKTICQLSVPIEFVYYCPHDEKDQCSCHLPSAYWAMKAKNQFYLNLAESIMVGVDEVDQRFAKNAGIKHDMHRDAFFWGGKTHMKGRAENPITAVKKVFMDV